MGDAQLEKLFFELSKYFGIKNIGLISSVGKAKSSLNVNISS